MHHVESACWFANFVIIYKARCTYVSYNDLCEMIFNTDKIHTRGTGVGKRTVTQSMFVFFKRFQKKQNLSIAHVAESFPVST